MNNTVKGTIGYAEVVDKYFDATIEIEFERLHQDFLEFIPTKKSQVLDIGAGIGRDASELAKHGHEVCAVEPTQTFLEKAKMIFDSPKIKWMNDSLPDLESLRGYENTFYFILASSVWHHIAPEEQKRAIKRIGDLLSDNGIFAVSLRHGPAGVGTHIHPTDGLQTITSAKKSGLTNLLHIPNQPSLMKGKKEVTWTRLVFRKSGKQKRFGRNISNNEKSGNDYKNENNSYTSS